MAGKRHQRMEETRAHALREAVKLFLMQGYNNTTVNQIADRIDRSPAALLRAYPDKESMLYALVTHMFGSQFGNVRKLLGEKADPLLVYGIETSLQIHICELSEPLRDLYVTAYTLPSTTEYIHHSTAKELQNIFAEYLPHAAESDFYELEIASGSLMRGYMVKPCDMYFTIERKLTLFLQCALKIYDVPADKRDAIVKQVLAMDLKSYAKKIVDDTVKLSEEGFDSKVLNAVLNNKSPSKGGTENEET
ncbi:MAG: TetR/AcrR family transcriptional regulator [Oscillospiraceae bacterium]|nr:TetR/AcrR family transcriptional regulator [Oscillospiraceae bacterium]